MILFPPVYVARGDDVRTTIVNGKVLSGIERH